MAAAEKPEPGGKTGGIKVHGHWMLEVRNPDGTLASRKEFENGLVTGLGGGSNALALLLSGEAAFGGWWVTLTTNVNNNAGYNIAQAPLCPFLAPTFGCANSLTVVVPNNPFGTQVVLQGTVPFTSSATIYMVGTSFGHM